MKIAEQLEINKLKQLCNVTAETQKNSANSGRKLGKLKGNSKRKLSGHTQELKKLRAATQEAQGKLGKLRAETLWKSEETQET